jgi:hypothetical protein
MVPIAVKLLRNILGVGILLSLKTIQKMLG